MQLFLSYTSRGRDQHPTTSRLTCALMAHQPEYEEVIFSPSREDVYAVSGRSGSSHLPVSPQQSLASAVSVLPCAPVAQVSTPSQPSAVPHPNPHASGVPYPRVSYASAQESRHMPKTPVESYSTAALSNAVPAPLPVSMPVETKLSLTPIVAASSVPAARCASASLATSDPPAPAAAPSQTSISSACDQIKNLLSAAGMSESDLDHEIMALKEKLSSAPSTVPQIPAPAAQQSAVSTTVTGAPLSAAACARPLSAPVATVNATAPARLGAAAGTLPFTDEHSPVRGPRGPLPSSSSSMAATPPKHPSVAPPQPVCSHVATVVSSGSQAGSDRLLCPSCGEDGLALSAQMRSAVQRIVEDEVSRQVAVIKAAMERSAAPAATEQVAAAPPRPHVSLPCSSASVSEHPGFAAPAPVRDHSSALGRSADERLHESAATPATQKASGGRRLWSPRPSPEQDQSTQSTHETGAGEKKDIEKSTTEQRQGEAAKLGFTGAFGSTGGSRPTSPQKHEVSPALPARLPGQLSPPTKKAPLAGQEHYITCRWCAKSAPPEHQSWKCAYRYGLYSRVCVT